MHALRAVGLTVSALGFLAGAAAQVFPWAAVDVESDRRGVRDFGMEARPWTFTAWFGDVQLPRRYY
ncbi:MAG: hypothetical protein AABY18_09345 [Candidatus Thermoplasmatota archaeon]